MFEKTRIVADGEEGSNVLRGKQHGADEDEWVEEGVSSNTHRVPQHRDALRNQSTGHMTLGNTHHEGGVRDEPNQEEAVHDVVPRALVVREY